MKRLQPETLLKKRLWHSCFPVNFAKFLRTPFLTEHSWETASNRFLYEGKIGFELIKIQLCEAKMCVMTVGSKKPSTYNMVIFVTIVKE